VTRRDWLTAFIGAILAMFGTKRASALPPEEPRSLPLQSRYRLRYDEVSFAAMSQMRGRPIGPSDLPEKLCAWCGKDCRVAWVEDTAINQRQRRIVAFCSDACADRSVSTPVGKPWVRGTSTDFIAVDGDNGGTRDIGPEKLAELTAALAEARTSPFSVITYLGKT
jgi:hypothetical protein